MKEAVVLLADGFEEIEAVTPVDYLRRAGVNVVTAAVDKDVPEVKGAHGITITADVTLNQYLAENKSLPDAVFAPGGMPGAANIGASKNAVSFISRMNEADRLVAAICAAPAVALPSTGALAGKKWTCYPGMSEEAGDFASTHTDGVPYVSDKNLVTGRGPGAAEQFAMELVRILCGEETASRIKKGSCQR